METRSDDEATLALLRDYASGTPLATLAAVRDVSLSTIKRWIAAVRDADIKHDPDALHYWAALYRKASK